MYTATFYSYRGGVGRTTALVNVAIDLALLGRKVVLIDFDLESPGLPSFVHLRPEGGTHPGLVEFIAEYLRSGKTPDVRNYVYPFRRFGEGCAEVWVMPAGRCDDKYWRAFDRINWKKLYNLQNGFLLFEDIKFQLRERFHPDYILIDSRAGINDRIAICTRQLPDAVVMMFTPDSAREPGVREQAGFQRELTAYEPDLSPIMSGERAGFQRVLADIVEESLKPGSQHIDILMVASKVPDLDNEALGESRLNELYEPGIIFDLTATIPFAPELLLDRQVVSSLRASKRLPCAYWILANALIRKNCTGDPDGAKAFLKKLQRDPRLAVEIPAEDPIDRWLHRTAQQLEQVIVSFDGDPAILAQAASCLYLAERYDRAMVTLDRAIEQAFKYEQSLDSVLWQKASYLRRLQPPKTVNVLLQMLDSHPARPAGHAGSTPTAPMDPATIRRWLRRMGRQSRPTPESPRLDTTPLDTADPLSRDFPGANPYVVSAFQQLRRIAPDKIQEAFQKPRIRELCPETRQALLDDAPPKPPFADTEQDPKSLIRNGQWRAAITLLEARVANPSPSCDDLLDLAIAHWGWGDDDRSVQRFREAREWFTGVGEPNWVFQVLDADNIHLIPLLSLMFWRTGDAITALKFVDRCDELLTEITDDEFFSYWRFHSVTRNQFQGDCHSLRMMIEGKAAISPPFLGPGRRPPPSTD